MQEPDCGRPLSIELMNEIPGRVQFDEINFELIVPPEILNLFDLEIESTISTGLGTTLTSKYMF